MEFHLQVSEYGNNMEFIHDLRDFLFVIIWNQRRIDVEM